MRTKRPTRKSKAPKIRNPKETTWTLTPPPVTRRSTLIDTVLKVFDAWERYRRSGQAANGDEAIRGFVDNMLGGVDWARVKPSMLRLAFSAVCTCLPTRELVLFRSAAERELNLLAECIADEDEDRVSVEDLDPQGREVLRSIQALRGPRPKAYKAAIAFIEALQEAPAYVHPPKASEPAER